MKERHEHEAAGAVPAPDIRCPFCDSDDVELMSLFGQQLLTVQCYCRACHTPFEKVKDAETLRQFGDRT